MRYQQTYQTPVGTITLQCDEEALLFLVFGKREFENTLSKSTALLERTIDQLKEYLAGERKEFDLALNPQGTDFQKKVWNALLTIPWGETKTYGEIAAQIGNPKACRAVGMANNRNPISIIIPCHRVIGAKGALVGYGGGLDIKEKLLKLEQ